jgi:ABC-2 type transport system permease protein
MNMRRLRAIARKEFIHVIRDARSLALAVLIPIFLLLLFGWALALDVDDVPTIVLDQSDTPESRDLLSYIGGGAYIRIVGYANNYDEIVSAIDRGAARAAVVIPREFADDVNAGRTAQVQVIADGSDSNTARLAIIYIENSAQMYGANAMVARAARSGAPIARAGIDYRPRVWYNPTLKSRNYIIPGLIALVMMVIAALLTSLTIAREWERGTMEQLISTPVRGPEIVVGKLIPYWLIGMLDVIIAMLMGCFVFGVPLRGNPVFVILMAAIFLVGALSIGLHCSISFKTQVLAAQMAILMTYLPTMFLAGFVFAIANMPKFHQTISYIVPARYFIALMRAVFLKGAGLEVIAPPALLLTVFSFIVFLTAVRKFKKKLA